MHGHNFLPVASVLPLMTMANRHETYKGCKMLIVTTTRGLSTYSQFFFQISADLIKNRKMRLHRKVGVIEGIKGGIEGCGEVLRLRGGRI
jgi:hypothetical protein